MSTEYKPTDRDTLLGFIVNSPALLDGFNIPDDFWKSDAQRAVWAAIREIMEEGGIASWATVRVRTPSSGVQDYLTAIAGGIVSIKPAEFRQEVRRMAAADLKVRIVAKIERDAKSGVSDHLGVTAMQEELRLLEVEGADQPAGNPLISFPELRAMDIHTEWLVGGLLPENSVTVLYGRTSIGKSWACLMIAEAVSAGLPIFGRATKQRPVVYIDMENPLAVMKDRAEALNMRSMSAQIWHSTMTPRPPKFDGPGWTLYKTMLPSNALIIIDTSRSAHDGKENDSDVAALVMGRCRELRDMGMTILILHHTPKYDDRELKASGAWADLADHTICFFKSKSRDSEEETGGEIPLGSPLCLGTGKKTRFAPSEILHMILTGHGLELTEDPDLETLNAIADYIVGEGCGKNQTELFAWAKGAEGLPKKKTSFTGLLDRGERVGRWRTYKGLRGAKCYEPAT